MRAIKIMAMAALATALPAQASNIQIRLRANVPVLCAIVDVRPIDLATGRVEVRAACNTEAFRVQLGGDLAGRTLHTALVDNGSSNIYGSSVTVRAIRPGQFRFTLDYGEDLSDVRVASASIDPL